MKFLADVFLLVMLLSSSFTTLDSMTPHARIDVSLPPVASTLTLSPPARTTSTTVQQPQIIDVVPQEAPFEALPVELIMNIVSQLHAHDQLQALANWSLTSKALNDIIQPLLKKMQPITLAVEDITQENLEKIALKHKQTYRIKVLLRAPSYPALTGRELKLLASYFPEVRELDISETDVTAKDLEALEDFKHLLALNISGNRLKANDLKILARLKLKKLEYSP